MLKKYMAAAEAIRDADEETKARPAYKLGYSDGALTATIIAIIVGALICG